VSIFALIPARGGSKGIPRKNIREIAGKPLIAWTIEAARAVPGIAAVVVSTEDEEIAAVARAAGAEVPFMRPVELAADETPGVDPVLHAIDQLPQYDAVLLLQATSPLRTSVDIEGLLVLAESSGAPAVVSVRAPHDHPQWMYRMGEHDALEALENTPPADRRQDLPAIYALNGAMYFARTDWLRAQRTFIGPGTLGYVMPSERSIDIDAPLDWRIAEMLLKDDN
jgi:CMP-N,N'-diacetyllegionaminic acid synthase